MSDSRHKDTKRKTDNRCAPMTAITQQPKLDAEMLLFIKVRHLIWRSSNFIHSQLEMNAKIEPSVNLFKRSILLVLTYLLTYLLILLSSRMYESLL
ncbi:hypothetical protein Y032_0153g2914 [Ancylostoma ceylanicum]|uniref:Uncharacterized protein n=1 Tax=Ancylostoma ceylanicum TaxID=53326 RepID=A0A016T0M6_9BILA|nr:hypothetical protein Y032_0153g2914 [Ancylostoma ceylanicum]